MLRCLSMLSIIPSRESRSAAVACLELILWQFCTGRWPTAAWLENITVKLRQGGSRASCPSRSRPRRQSTVCLGQT